MPRKTFQITPGLLQAVGADLRYAEIYAALLEPLRVVPGDAYNTISSQAGIAMLVSQLAHESGYFSTLSENLNYTVEALRTGNRAKYFSPTQADSYGAIRNGQGIIRSADQRMIANLYYGGRLGNQAFPSNDGWTFRGAGLIQLTGRANHKRFAVTRGLTPEQGADYCRTPEGAVSSALWFWRSNQLLIPASWGDVTRCTEIIQGADGGLSARIALYKAALSALN